MLLLSRPAAKGDGYIGAAKTTGITQGNRRRNIHRMGDNRYARASAIKLVAVSYTHLWTQFCKRKPPPRDDLRRCNRHLPTPAPKRNSAHHPRRLSIARRPFTGEYNSHFLATVSRWLYPTLKPRVDSFAGSFCRLSQVKTHASRFHACLLYTSRCV